MRTILALILWLCITALAVAQCVGGRCPTPALSTPATGPVWTPSFAPVMPVQNPQVATPYREFKPISKYRWVKVQSNPDQEALLEDGVQVGCWSLSGGYYRALKSDGTWGPKQYTAPDGSWAKPPRVPVGMDTPETKAEGKSRLDFGMNYTPGQQAKYTICDEKGNCKEISRKRAIQAVEGPNASDIPDDSKKFRVTLVGNKESRKKAAEDLGKLPGDVKDKVIVHQYDADSAMVQKLGLVKEGNPSVTLQAPDGQVLGRNLDGTWDVSRVEAIEDEVKSYDPTKDVDLRRRKPILPTLPTLPQAQIPWWIWAAGAGALVLLFKRK